MATRSIGCLSGLIKKREKRVTTNVRVTLNVAWLLKLKSFIAKIHNAQSNNKLISEFIFENISIITPIKNKVIKKNRNRLSSFKQ